MDKFQIVATATFGAGARLGLSKEQAAARVHSLREVARGVYVAQQPVQFKAGEVIGLDGEIPKSLGAAVSAPKAKRASKPAAPEATDDSAPADPGERPAE